MRAARRWDDPPRSRGVLLCRARRRVRARRRGDTAIDGDPPLTYDYGLWLLVVFHVVGLAGFAYSFLGPARRREWRSLGVFSAFVVALYVEMYGFPLTIYVLTALLGQLPVPEPFAHMSGNLWATLVLGPRMAGPLMLVGGVMILGGAVIVGVAWKWVYRAQGTLVTAGPYAVVRHPQYSALFVIILGALVQWPTLLTLIMAPVLVVAYVRLAWREERELEARLGDAYHAYRRRVPGFVPALRFPTAEPEPDVRTAREKRRFA